MQLWVAQILGMVATFVVTILCMVLPLKVFPTGGSRLNSRKTQRIISLCNCLSGGVFLGTYFVALVPYIREKFIATFHMIKIDLDYPVTETSVVAGLFLVMFVEQVMKVCQKKKVEVVEINMDPVGTTSEHLHTSTSSDSEHEESGELIGTTHKGKKYLQLKQEESRENITVQLANTAASNPTENEINQIENGAKKNKVRRFRKKRKKKRDQSQTGAHGHSHHGHNHSHLPEQLLTEQSLRSFILVIALSLHSFFEGLALGLQDTMIKFINIFVAVITHECLVAFAMGINLAKQGIKFSLAMKISVLLCLMIPVGMAVGMGIGGIHNFGGNIASAAIQGIAAGTFLYVIFLEILPDELQAPDDGLLKIFVILVGYIMVACLAIVLKHDE